MRIYQKEGEMEKDSQHSDGWIFRIIGIMDYALGTFPLILSSAPSKIAIKADNNFQSKIQDEAISELTLLMIQVPCSLTMTNLRLPKPKSRYRMMQHIVLSP